MTLIVPRFTWSICETLCIPAGFNVQDSHRMTATESPTAAGLRFSKLQYFL